MKKIRNLVVIFIFMILCTGCVKYNANMTIKKDKSMDFSIVYAVNSSLMGDDKILDDDEIKKLKKEGYTIEEYDKDDMKGFIITKKYKNIDDISSDKKAKYSLSGILEKENNNSKVFKVKKGLFKNRYYANFEFDSSNSSLNSDLSDDSLDTDYENDDEETDDTYFESEEETDDILSDDFNLDSLSNMSSNMDLSFNVKLPYKSIKNNASSTKNEDKELKWDLSKENEDAIKFEFELYNYKNIYLTIGISSILLVGIIVLLVILLNKKKKGAE